MLLILFAGCLVEPVEDVAKHPTHQRPEIPSSRQAGEGYPDNPRPHLEVPHEGEIATGDPSGQVAGENGSSSGEKIGHCAPFCNEGIPGEVSLSDHNPPDEVEPEAITGEISCNPVPTSTHRFGKDNMVGLSGSIELVGFHRPLLIEVVRPNQGQYLVAYSLECTSGDVFTLSVPASLKQVYLVAFSDEEGDGPTQSDPYGRSELIDLTKAPDTIAIKMDKGKDISPIPVPLEPEVPLADTSLKPHGQTEESIKQLNPDADPSGKEIANPQEYNATE